MVHGSNPHSPFCRFLPRQLQQFPEPYIFGDIQCDRNDFREMSAEVRNCTELERIDMEEHRADAAARRAEAKAYAAQHQAELKT